MAGLTERIFNEAAVPERGEDPPLRLEHGRLRLSLIRRMVPPGRNDRETLVAGELQIGLVDHLDHGSLREAWVTLLRRLSGTTTTGLAPKNSSILTWTPIQEARF